MAISYRYGFLVLSLLLLLQHLQFAVALSPVFASSFTSVRMLRRLNFAFDKRSTHLYTATNSRGNLKGGGGDIVVSEVQRCNFNGAGCVLLSSSGEFDHFLSKAAVFVVRHDDEGSQGVILDKPTAFSMGETSPNSGVFAPNTLYMGGETGSDTALFLHKYEMDGACTYIGGGIYTGGYREARQMVEDRLAHPRDFKFIFNYVEWGPGTLEKEIAAKKWDVVRVPPHLILEHGSTSYLWSRARNIILSNQGSSE